MQARWSIFRSFQAVNELSAKNTGALTRLGFLSVGSRECDCAEGIELISVFFKIDLMSVCCLEEIDLGKLSPVSACCINVPGQPKRMRNDESVRGVTPTGGA
jgi:hypothetical protein